MSFDRIREGPNVFPPAVTPQIVQFYFKTDKSTMRVFTHRTKKGISSAKKEFLRQLRLQKYIINEKIREIKESNL